MKLLKSWRARLAIILVASSAALYLVHYLIFHDFHHIAIYTVHDIAFLPLEVLLVTMVLHTLLERRAKREMLYKLNMVIGAFFSEVGTGLLGRLASFGENVEDVRSDLVVRPSWTHREFANATRELSSYDFRTDAGRGDLAELRDFLVSKRDFLLRLLENPNLLEHESFTDSLWAVFHLAEELEYRTDIGSLPPTDLAHLSGDIKRALGALTVEWVQHLEHLKDSYPYLFSLAVRVNPLDSQAHVEVTA
ncbi:MAG: hypothetical protein U1F44_02505 [Coriobacteriia bacterium]|nr:hypothetical protein [Coriobacteriia bacterium]